MRGDGGVDRDYLVWDHGLYTVQRAVRTKQHLMVRTYDPQNFNQFRPVELYDIVADPYQSEDISEQNLEIVEQCDHYMAEWIHEQMAKGHTTPDPIQLILQERQKRNA